MSLINDVLQGLEKRHASESELKTLPPYVRAVPDRPQSHCPDVPGRRSTSWPFSSRWSFLSLAAVRAPEDVARQIVPKPMAVPSPAPVPASPVPAPSPVAGLPAQTATFNPVSRLSDELSLIAPPPARPEKPAGIGRTGKPGPARPVVDAEATSLPQAEKSPAPASGCRTQYRSGNQDGCRDPRASSAPGCATVDRCAKRARRDRQANA